MPERVEEHTKEQPPESPSRTGNNVCEITEAKLNDILHGSVEYVFEGGFPKYAIFGNHPDSIFRYYRAYNKDYYERFAGLQESDYEVGPWDVVPFTNNFLSREHQKLRLHFCNLLDLRKLKQLAMTVMATVTNAPGDDDKAVIFQRMMPLFEYLESNCADDSGCVRNFRSSFSEWQGKLISCLMQHEDMQTVLRECEVLAKWEFSHLIFGTIIIPTIADSFRWWPTHWSKMCLNVQRLYEMIEHELEVHPYAIKNEIPSKEPFSHIPNIPRLFSPNYAYHTFEDTYDAFTIDDDDDDDCEELVLQGVKVRASVKFTCNQHSLHTVAMPDEFGNVPVENIFNTQYFQNNHIRFEQLTKGVEVSGLLFVKAVQCHSGSNPFDVAVVVMGSIEMLSEALQHVVTETPPGGRARVFLAGDSAEATAANLISHNAFWKFCIEVVDGSSCDALKTAGSWLKESNGRQRNLLVIAKGTQNGNNLSQNGKHQANTRDDAVVVRDLKNSCSVHCFRVRHIFDRNRDADIVDLLVDQVKCIDQDSPHVLNTSMKSYMKARSRVALSSVRVDFNQLAQHIQIPKEYGNLKVTLKTVYGQSPRRDSLEFFLSWRSPFIVWFTCFLKLENASPLPETESIPTLPQAPTTLDDADSDRCFLCLMENQKREYRCSRLGSKCRFAMCAECGDDDNVIAALPKCPCCNMQAQVWRLRSFDVGQVVRLLSSVVFSPTQALPKGSVGRIMSNHFQDGQGIPFWPVKFVTPGGRVLVDCPASLIADTDPTSFTNPGDQVIILDDTRRLYGATAGTIAKVSSVKNIFDGGRKMSFFDKIKVTLPDDDQETSVARHSLTKLSDPEIVWARALNMTINISADSPHHQEPNEDDAPQKLTISKTIPVYRDSLSRKLGCI